MSMKCEEPIDELTVQVWLQYDHPNFRYCTLFLSETELRMDGQMDEGPAYLSGQGQKNFGKQMQRTDRWMDKHGNPSIPSHLTSLWGVRLWGMNITTQSVASPRTPHLSMIAIVTFTFEL